METNHGSDVIGTAREKAAEAAVMLDLDALLLGVASHLNEHYGPRCTTFNPDCATCQVWRALDRISCGFDEAGAFS